ncbi:hypothetical protein [Halobaculum limi]|uniref:hypothetical protein n=1 Tax=Halobaculum limi TaxID=3031916 RepID=UPI0024053E3F|nr:hypothetical protein [Halobaculum sp. YSMS11]
MRRSTLSLSAWIVVGALQVVLGGVEFATGADSALQTTVRILVGAALVVSFARALTSDADRPAVTERLSFTLLGILLAFLWAVVLINNVLA